MFSCGSVGREILDLFFYEFKDLLFGFVYIGF